MADGSGSFDARGGRDPAALAAVYRAHSAYVWRVLRHCGVPDSDLDDAVQETFLVVFRRLPGFEARASLRTWIYAVAVRVASTRRRSQRREAARREHAGHGMHGAGAADPEAELSKAEAADLVDRLLDELDASKRTVFVLAELEGVKVPEISRILGVNPRTVHSRLRLARESFGSALERLRAREAGNRRVARLRPRPLLEHAANERPTATRRKAAMAALAARIEQGEMPMLPGWEGLALGSGGLGAWGLPLAVLGAVSVMAAVAVAAGKPTGDPSRSTSDVAREAAASSESAPNVARGAAVSSASAPNAPEGASGSSSTKDATTGAYGSSSPPEISTSGAYGSSSSPEIPASGAYGSSSSPKIPTPGAYGSSSSPKIPTPGAYGSSSPPKIPTAGASPSSSPPSNPPAEALATSDPPPTASTLAAETELLEEARSALRRGEPQAAFDALDRHASRFPAGLLRDEARSTRLRALCAGGRSEAATALADRWAPGEPHSRWHEVVAAACG